MIAHVGPAAVLKFDLSRTNLLRGSAETHPLNAVAYHGASSSSHGCKSSPRLACYRIAVEVRAVRAKVLLGPFEQADKPDQTILPFPDNPETFQ